jgi:microcystin-dependent protein
MAEPFLSEIRIMSFGFPPKGWALCNGQTLPINQNAALFSLLGTVYGGNGVSTFALPDCRGRTPIHFGAGNVRGERAGEMAHTLIVQEMPAHNHVAQGTTQTGDTPVPAANLLADSPAQLYAAASNLTTLRDGTVTNNGGSQPHPNAQPYTTLNFCIALQGIFPSQN